MKIGHITSPTIASECMTKSVMGMSRKGVELASWVMRDKIYSDKPLAVVREYICNAVDEHKKYNVTKPVMVSLKREDNIFWWRCRDFAKGLDDHGVRNIFGQYFESTKNRENDSIGGFGVGSKAGHAYTDTFYITSYFEGTKTTYACVLGAGNNGIPVGEIFEVGKESTTETGIEIAVEIKKGDDYSFRNKSINIVKAFDPSIKIEFDFGGSDKIVPMKPDMTHVEDGFIINSYSGSFPRSERNSYHASYACVRMGGIVYETNLHILGVQANGNLVIDVPIGSMTIPITRESFDDSDDNNAIFDKIREIVQKMNADELSKIPHPKVKDILKMGKWEYFNQDNKTAKWFSHRLSTLFDKEYAFTSGLRLFEKKEEFTDTSNNIIYVFPNIRSTKTWEFRLRKHLKLEDNHYNSVCESYVNTYLHNIDVTGLQFVKVKEMGLPKIAIPKDSKGNRKYATYTSSGSYSRYGSSYNNATYFTSSELEEHVKNSLKQTDDLDEDWHETVETRKELEMRTIALKGSRQSSSSSYITYYCNSKKFVQEMLDLGWIEWDSVEYRAALSRIQEKINIRRARETAVEDLYTYLGKTKYSDKLVEAVKSKPERIEKLIDLASKIAREDSFRGRFMKFYRDEMSTWYDSKNLTRADIRKILRMV